MIPIEYWIPLHAIGISCKVWPQYATRKLDRRKETRAIGICLLCYSIGTITIRQYYWRKLNLYWLHLNHYSHLRRATASAKTWRRSFLFFSRVRKLKHTSTNAHHGYRETFELLCVCVYCARCSFTHLGALAKAVRLFIGSLHNQPMDKKMCSQPPTVWLVFESGTFEPRFSGLGGLRGRICSHLIARPWVPVGSLYLTPKVYL